MNRSNRLLKKKFTAFVDRLTPNQAKEQLVLAYLQMENCRSALNGADVEPVSMMDNGDSSDLELFYQCKKIRAELDYLNSDEFNDERVDEILVLLYGSKDEAYQYLHDSFMEGLREFFKNNPVRVVKRRKRRSR